MRDALGKFIFKRAVTLVYIEIVLFVEIIAYVNVRIHISIKIADRNAKSIRNFDACDSGLLTYINKMPIIIAHKLVTKRISYFSRGVKIKFVDIYKTVVKNVGIQVVVKVIVKKGNMSRKPGVVSTKL